MLKYIACGQREPKHKGECTTKVLRNRANGTQNTAISPLFQHKQPLNQSYP